MSNNTPIHPNIWKKEKKTERERREEVGPIVHAERERSEGTRHSIDVYGARRSAWSSSGEGQRATATMGREEVRGRVGGYMWVLGLLRLVVLWYITKSMVLVSPSVKICDFLFFFLFFFLHCWRVRLVRAVSKTVQGVRKIGNLPQGSSFLSTRKSAMYLHFLVSFFFFFWQWKFWKICVRMEFPMIV